MSDETIDAVTAKTLADTASIHSAAIIGRTGGWTVLLRLEKSQKTLSKRNGEPHLWRSLDLCIAFLKSELQIIRFDLLDASDHSDTPVDSDITDDPIEHLSEALDATEYDRWFRAEIEEAIKEADDPNTEWVSHEDVKASWEKKRAELLKQIEKDAD